jgi:hypothetical protein
MIGTFVDMALSDDEKKFAWFWVIIFTSALCFWAIALHWLWQYIAPYLT